MGCAKKTEASVVRKIAVIEFEELLASKGCIGKHTIHMIVSMEVSINSRSRSEVKLEAIEVKNQLYPLIFSKASLCQYMLYTSTYDLRVNNKECLLNLKCSYVHL